MRIPSVVKKELSSISLLHFLTLIITAIFYEKRKVFQWIMYYVNLNAREKRDVRNVY